MSHRIRAVLAVLAAGAVVVPLWRRYRALERDLTATQAGHRLVDHVIHADHVVAVENLERRLSNLAAAVRVPAAPTPKPTATTGSDPKEGGHQ